MGLRFNPYNLTTFSSFAQKLVSFDAILLIFWNKKQKNVILNEIFSLAKDQKSVSKRKLTYFTKLVMQL